MAFYGMSTLFDDFATITYELWTNLAPKSMNISGPNFLWQLLSNQKITEREEFEIFTILKNLKNESIFH